MSAGAFSASTLFVTCLDLPPTAIFYGFPAGISVLYYSESLQQDKVWGTLPCTVARSLGDSSAIFKQKNSALIKKFYFRELINTFFQKFIQSDIEKHANNVTASKMCTKLTINSVKLKNLKLSNYFYLNLTVILLTNL